MPDDPDHELWRPPPTPAVLAAREQSERLRREAVEEVLATSISAEQAAERLGVTIDALLDAVRAGKLIALSTAGAWHVPAWQFRRGEPLPGLASVIDAWPGTTLSLALWMTRPNVELDGRTPAEELGRRGDLRRVLEAVRALTPEAW